MDRKEPTYMGLEEAVESQKEKYPKDYCFECHTEDSMVITKRTIPLYGITVMDFPAYKCEICGNEDSRISISIAVENLRDKHKLQGAYTLDELLQIEKQGSHV